MKNIQQGFTLTESLIALAVLLVALSFSIQGFLGNLNINSRNDSRTQAATIAQRVLDSYRLLDPSSSDIPTSGVKSGTLTDGNGISWPYTVTFCSTPSYCGAGSRQIRVEVNKNGQSIYTAETVYTQLFYETEDTK